MAINFRGARHQDARLGAAAQHRVQGAAIPAQAHVHAVGQHRSAVIVADGGVVGPAAGGGLHEGLPGGRQVLPQHLLGQAVQLHPHLPGHVLGDALLEPGRHRLVGGQRGVHQLVQHQVAVQGGGPPVEGAAEHRGGGAAGVDAQHLRAPLARGPAMDGQQLQPVAGPVAALQGGRGPRLQGRHPPEVRTRIGRHGRADQLRNRWRPACRAGPR